MLNVNSPRAISPFEMRAADDMADKVEVLVRSKRLDPNCPADAARKAYVRSKQLETADTLAYEILCLTRTGVLDSRCEVADAMLEYALTRFHNSGDSVPELAAAVEERRRRPRP